MRAKVQLKNNITHHGQFPSTLSSRLEVLEREGGFGFPLTFFEGVK